MDTRTQGRHSVSEVDGTEARLVAGNLQHADARLIAAAPELLAALRLLADCVSMPGPHGGKVYAISDERMGQARALLARVDGGAL